MKLYIPTTSLNFNNILSTESISPKGFYASRGFGYSRWFSIPENDIDGAILLYEFPAVLVRPKSDLEDHPLLIEIDTDEVFPVAKEGVRYSKHSIYLNPWNTKFIFQSEKDQTVAYSLSDSSLETKMLRLYNNKIIVASAQGSFPTMEGISLDFTIEDSCIEKDRQINKIKGLLYGYYIGACLSSSKDDIEQINILKEIQNIFAAVVSSVERTPSNVQKERLECLFTSYAKKDSLYQELLAEIGNVDKINHMLEILQKYGIKVAMFDWRRIVNELQYDSDGSNYAISWIKSEISKLRKKMASCNILLSPDAEEIITSNGKISKASSIMNNEENQLYISWVNSILINFNGKVSSNRAELADAITKSAIDTLGDKWANSSIRTFLNQLRRHVRGEEFTQPWDNGVLSSIAAVISKGDDWENLLNFMQSKGMTDYRIAFSFYGILNGFANLTRDFTDILLNQKSIYVAEIYREFYGQLHGITIDINKISNIEDQKEKHEVFIKEPHEMLVTTPMEQAENNDLREQQCKEIWEFFNNSPAVPKSGNKKEKLKEGLHLCLKRYTGEICLSQFIMDLNDFDEYGWKKSNKPWKSMQERFSPDYNARVGTQKGIGGKAKETPSLFDSIKEGNQQVTQTVSTAQAKDLEQKITHSIREEEKSNASRYGKSILEDTAWINECASMISDSRASIQFLEDMEWFVGNHHKTYKDKKKGTVKGYYAGHDCTNERVIERLKVYMENRLKPRYENMRWLAEIYAKIPINNIIDYISKLYGN